MPRYVVNYEYFSWADEAPPREEHTIHTTGLAWRVEAASHEEAYARWYFFHRADLDEWSHGTVISVYEDRGVGPIPDLQRYNLKDPLPLHIEAIIREMVSTGAIKFTP